MNYKAKVAPRLMAQSIVLVVLGLVTVSCQTTGTKDKKAQYNIFFSPIDHVEKLLKAGEIEAASAVYNDQQDYFQEPTSNRETAVATLIESIEQHLSSRLRNAQDQLSGLSWPAEEEKWSGTKATLLYANSVLDSVEVHKAMFHKGRRPDVYRNIKSIASKFSGQIADGASEALSVYPLGRAPSFFDAYPVFMTNDDGLITPVGSEFKKAFLKENAESIRQQVSAANIDELKLINRLYKEFLPDELVNQIGNRYLDNIFKPAGHTEAVSLAKIIEGIKRAKSEEFEFDNINSVRIALVDVTSRTLKDEGQIEFPTSIDVDLPFEVSATDVDKAFESEIASAADIVIFVDVAEARTDREILKQARVPSLFQSGTKIVSNPDYAVVRSELNQANMARQNAAINTASVNSQYCQGWGCLAKVAAVAISAAAEASAQKKVDELVQRLSETPLNLEKPEYSSYTYVKADIQSAKLATVHYHIIDRTNQTYFRDTFDVRQEKEFVVPYKVRKDDKDYEGAIAGLNRETEVVMFEESEVEVRLSSLLEQFSSASEKLQPMPPLLDVRTEILTDKNKALAAYRSRQFSAKPINDDRFSRVVVVYHPGGSLGAGFYVRDDLVLTNFHVIEQTKFVELQTFQGNETFGKVIASDPRLDLALVRVQARGVPVSFYSDNVMPLGATVEAIGHPKGHKFSITRGVVSALREIKSINVPGGKKVLFIQSDVVMNGGNSGGPMFLGNTVVGVNTWKRTDLEGIGFAVHYSEILNFLRKNGINIPQTGERS